MSNNIILPLNIAALKVSNEDKDGKVASATINYNNRKSKEGEVQDWLFPFTSSQSKLNVGIHLHWTLPDAYNVAEVNNDEGEHVFHTIPNRWLVVRMHRDMSDFSQLPSPEEVPKIATYNTAMWLIQSDAIHDIEAEGIPIVGLEEGHPLEFKDKRIGYKKYLKKENGSFQYALKQFERSESLSSMSYYGMTFSSYYQNSKNILGFEDNLFDLYGKKDGQGWYLPEQVKKYIKCKVSYGVIGWHDGDEDYFSAVVAPEIKKWESCSGEIFQENLRKLLLDKSKLTLPEENFTNATITNENYQNVKTICSGIVSQLDFNLADKLKSDTTYEPKKPKLRMSLGNTAVESMSAYLANSKNSLKAGIDPKLQSNMEMLFSAMQMGQLRRLDTRSGFGIAQLEEQIHEETFRSKSGGQIWFVKDLKKENDPTVIAEIKSGVLPISIAAQLAALNRLQKEFDVATAEIYATQNQLFLGWHKHIEALHHLSDVKINESNSARYILTGLYNYLFPKMMDVGQLLQDKKTRAISFSHFDYILKQDTSELVDDLPINLPSMEIELGEQIRSLIQLSFNLKYGKELTQIIIKEKETINGSSATINDRVRQLANVLESIATLTVSKSNNVLEILMENVNDSKGRIASFSNELDNLDDFYGPKAIGNLGYTIDVTKGYNEYSKVKDFLNTGPGILHAKVLDFWLDEEDDLIDDARESLLQKPKEWVEGLNLAGEKLMSSTKGIPFAIEGFKSFNEKAAAIRLELEGIGRIGWDKFDETKYSLDNLLNLFDGCDELASTQERIVHIILGQWSMAQRTTFMYDALQESLQTISMRLTLLNIANDSFYMPHDPVLTMIEDVQEGQIPILKPFQRNSNASYTPARTTSDLVSGTISPQLQITLHGDTGHGKEFLNDLNMILEEVSIIGNFRNEIVEIEDFQKECERFYENINSYQERQKKYINPIPDSATEMMVLFEHDTKSEIYEQGGDSIADVKGIMPFYSGIELMTERSLNSFYPLFMIYEVDMWNDKLHDGDAYDSNILLDTFALAEEDKLDGNVLYHSDLKYISTPKLENEKVKFYNYIMLSRSPNASLIYQIEKYLHDYKADLDPKTAQKIITVQHKIANQLFLSQRLSGFHENLLQKLQTMQLPIHIDYDQIPYESIDQPVSTVLRKNSQIWETYNRDWNANIPVLNKDSSPFQPVRSGFAGFNNLYLIDSFGQYFSFSPNEDMVVGCDLKHQENVKIPDEAKRFPVQLPPRIVEPVRLKYNWISNRKPLGGHYFEMEGEVPEYSPICGWLVPNHLDGSLAVYNDEGNPIEYWRTYEKSIGVYTLPGKQYEMNPILQKLKSKMQDLQSNLGKYGGLGFLNRFMNAAGIAQNNSHPTYSGQERSLAVYMGKPMVVVRLKIRLERQGNHSIQLTKTTPGSTSPLPDFLNPLDEKCIKTDLTEIYSPNHFKTPKYDKVKIPLLLGNTPQHNDGLIGYFIETTGTGGNGDFDLSHSPFITDAIDAKDEVKGIIERHDSERIALSLENNTSSEVSLFVLMEPRLPIHIVTGILPVKKIELAIDIYNQTINKLALYFLAAPILTSYRPDRDSIPTRSIPIDPIHNFSWHWLEKSKPKKTGQLEAEPALMQVKNEVGLTLRGMPSDGSDLLEPKIIDGWLKLDREIPKINMLAMYAKLNGTDYTDHITIHKGHAIEVDCQLTILQEGVSLILDQDFTILIQLENTDIDFSIGDKNWGIVDGSENQFKWMGKPDRLNAFNAKLEIKKVSFSVVSASDLGHLNLEVVITSISKSQYNGQPNLLTISPVKVETL